MRVAIIAVSDVDASLTHKVWNFLSDYLRDESLELAYEAVVEKERPFVAGEILRCCDERDLDVVLTIGGCKLASNDIVPEATKDVCLRGIPGLSKQMYSNASESCISRHVAMQRGTTLVINLPEETDELQFCLERISRVLPLAVKSAHS